jgi:hypothetical protein
VTRFVAIHCVATRFVAVADRSAVAVNRDALADHCAALQIAVLHAAAPNAAPIEAPNEARNAVLNGVRRSFADERARRPVAPVVFQEQSRAG